MNIAAYKFLLFALAAATIYNLKNMITLFMDICCIIFPGTGSLPFATQSFRAFILQLLCPLCI